MISKSLQMVKNNVWKTVTIIVTLFGVIGAVWGVEDRYANKTIVVASMEQIQQQQQALQETQQTFQKSQELTIQQQKINYLRSRMEFYQEMLNQIRYDRSIVINHLRANPNDMYLVEKKQELDRREKILINRMDSCMNEMGRIQ